MNLDIFNSGWFKGKLTIRLKKLVTLRGLNLHGWARMKMMRLWAEDGLSKRMIISKADSIFIWEIIHGSKPGNPIDFFIASLLVQFLKF